MAKKVVIIGGVAAGMKTASRPERLLASYLYNLSDVDPLWSKIADGYTKQFCFREYSMEQINAGWKLLFSSGVG